MDIGQKITGRFGPQGQYGMSVGIYVPLISIDIAGDPNWFSGSPSLPASLKSGLSALIDTGSDVTRIDQGIATSLGLQTIGAIPSTFTGLQSTTQIFNAQLVVPLQRFVAGGALHSANFKIANVYYDAIIGWDILRLFEVHLNPKKGVVELTYIG